MSQISENMEKFNYERDEGVGDASEEVATLSLAKILSLKGTNPVLSDIIDRSITEKLSSPSGNAIREIFCNAVNAELMQVATVVKKNVVVPCHPSLSDVSKIALKNAYPWYEIKFTDRNANAHGIAAASRIMETFELLRKIGYDRAQFSRYHEFNVIKRSDYICDIGGNYVHHFAAGNLGIHSCSPVLSCYDIQRHTDRRNTMVNMAINGSLSSVQAKMYNEFKNVDFHHSVSSFMCMRKAQNCTRTALNGMMVHSNYDITLKELADIMFTKKIDVCYGTFIFSPEIFTAKQGIIKDLNVMFEIGKGKITFSFKDDSSFNYIHDFNNYMSYLTVSVFTTSDMFGYCSLELQENRLGVQYFKVVRLDMNLLGGSSIELSLSRKLWLSHLDNKVRIQYYSFDYDMYVTEFRRMFSRVRSYWKGFKSLITKRYDIKNFYADDLSNMERLMTSENYISDEDINAVTGVRNFLKKKVFYVDKEIVDQCIRFAYTTQDGKFEVKEICSYLCANMSKVFVGNTVIRRNTCVSDHTMFKELADAIYVYVYYNKYNYGKVMQEMLGSIDYNRNLSEATLFGKFFKFQWRRLGVRGSAGSSANMFLYRLWRKDYRFNEMVSEAPKFIHCNSVVNSNSSGNILTENNDLNIPLILRETCMFDFDKVLSEVGKLVGCEYDAIDVDTNGSVVGYEYNNKCLVYDDKGVVSALTLDDDVYDYCTVENFNLGLRNDKIVEIDGHYSLVEEFRGFVAQLSDVDFKRFVPQKCVTKGNFNNSAQKLNEILVCDLVFSKALDICSAPGGFLSVFKQRGIPFDYHTYKNSSLSVVTTDKAPLNASAGDLLNSGDFYELLRVVDGRVYDLITVDGAISNASNMVKDNMELIMREFDVVEHVCARNVNATVVFKLFGFNDIYSYNSLSQRLIKFGSVRFVRPYSSPYLSYEYYVVCQRFSPDGVNLAVMDEFYKFQISLFQDLEQRMVDIIDRKEKFYGMLNVDNCVGVENESSSVIISKSDIEIETSKRVNMVIEDSDSSDSSLGLEYEVDSYNLYDEILDCLNAKYDCAEKIPCMSDVECIGSELEKGDVDSVGSGTNDFGLVADVIGDSDESGFDEKFLDVRQSVCEYLRDEYVVITDKDVIDGVFAVPIVEEIDEILTDEDDYVFVDDVECGEDLTVRVQDTSLDSKIDIKDDSVIVYNSNIFEDVDNLEDCDEVSSESSTFVSAFGGSEENDVMPDVSKSLNVLDVIVDVVSSVSTEVKEVIDTGSMVVERVLNSKNFYNCSVCHCSCKLIDTRSDGRCMFAALIGNNSEECVRLKNIMLRYYNNNKHRIEFAMFENIYLELSDNTDRVLSVKNWGSIDSLVLFSVMYSSSVHVSIRNKSDEGVTIGKEFDKFRRVHLYYLGNHYSISQTKAVCGKIFKFNIHSSFDLNLFNQCVSVLFPNDIVNYGFSDDLVGVYSPEFSSCGSCDVCKNMYISYIVDKLLNRTHFSGKCVFSFDLRFLDITEFLSVVGLLKSKYVVRFMFHCLYRTVIFLVVYDIASGVPYIDYCVADFNYMSMHKNFCKSKPISSSLSFNGKFIVCCPTSVTMEKDSNLRYGNDNKLNTLSRSDYLLEMLALEMSYGWLPVVTSVRFYDAGVVSVFSRVFPLNINTVVHTSDKKIGMSVPVVPDLELGNISDYTVYKNAMNEVKHIWRMTGTHVIHDIDRLHKEQMSVIGSVEMFVVADESYGMFDLQDMVWIVCPRGFNNDDYMFCYDGVELIPLVVGFFSSGTSLNRKMDMIKNIRSYSRVENLRYISVNKSTKVIVAHKMYSIVEKFDLKDYSFDVDVVIRRGGPGVGKTTEILREHSVDVEFPYKHIVITATSETKIDFRTRVETCYPDKLSKVVKNNKYRTMDSFIMHYHKFKDVYKGCVDVVYFDEAFMVHPGQIFWILYLLKPKKAVICGDYAQIRYVCRYPINLLFGDVLLNGKFKYEIRNVSKRCPLDVVYLMNVLKLYPFEMKTTSGVEHSMSVVGINTVKDIKLVSEKNVQTLVFTQSEKRDVMDAGFSNVMTIHEYQGRQSESVILIRLRSIPLDIFNQCEYLLVAISRHTKNFKYYTVVVNDKLSEWITCVMNVDKYRLLVHKERYVGGGQFADFSINPIIDSSAKFIDQRDVLRRLVINNQGSSNVPFRLHYREIDHRLFEFYSSDGYRDFELEPSYVANSMLVLQDFYDTVRPGARDYASRHDEFLFETSDFNVQCRDFSFLLYSNMPKLRDYLSSRLHTACPNVVNSNSVRQVVKAFNERNGNVPEYMGDQSSIIMAEEMFDVFKIVYLDNSFSYLCENFCYNQVYVNVTNIEEWLRTQPPNTITKIEPDKDVHLWDKIHGYYSYILKRIGKPVLENNALFKNASPQAIAHHEVLFNTIFCPIVKQIKSRFLGVLKKNFVVNTDIDFVELENILNVRFPPNRLDGYKCLEVDFSKFDKSQLLLMLEFEVRFLLFFGFPSEWIDTWIVVHLYSVLKNFKLKFKGNVYIQRKSGDPLTFLGNTVYMMSILSHLLITVMARSKGVTDVFTYMNMYPDDIDKNFGDIFAIFAGDDSSMFIPEKFYNIFDLSEFSRLSELRYNMEAKLLQFDSFYFCSKFLIPVDRFRWIIVPDCLKLIIKFGRRDLVDFEHAEAYRVSVLDNLKRYRNSNYYGVMTDAFNDRYGFCFNDLSYVFRAMFWLFFDKKQFDDLYFLYPGDVLSKVNLRPSLDI